MHFITEDQKVEETDPDLSSTPWRTRKEKWHHLNHFQDVITRGGARLQRHTHTHHFAILTLQLQKYF